jgi:hypothetical protein
MYIPQTKHIANDLWTDLEPFPTAVAASQYLWDRLEKNGFRHSGMQEHMKDLQAGRALTSERGVQFRIVHAPSMNTRTDHSKQINDLRFIAGEFEKMAPYVRENAERYVHEAVQARAAADLLEIHDATGLNLCEAPGLLAFVESMGGGSYPHLIEEFKVENNHS